VDDCAKFSGARVALVRAETILGTTTFDQSCVFAADRS
jgi:hypothetical protein